MKNTPMVAQKAGLPMTSHKGNTMPMPKVKSDKIATQGSNKIKGSGDESKGSGLGTAKLSTSVMSRYKS